MATARYGAAVSGAPRSRAAGWWGWIFVLLLMGSAGMTSAPGGTALTSTVRAFYTANSDVIVVAQIMGLVAAVVFLPFAFALRWRARTPDTPLDVEAAGCVVTAAAVLTAVPVLWLSMVATTGSDSLLHILAVTSDLTDVFLFIAISWWAWALVGAASPVWFRLVATAVAALTLARAALLLVRSSELELVAPASFVVLVVVLSTAVLAGHSPMSARPDVFFRPGRTVG